MYFYVLVVLVEIYFLEIEFLGSHGNNYTSVSVTWRLVVWYISSEYYREKGHLILWWLLLLLLSLLLLLLFFDNLFLVSPEGYHNPRL